MLLTIQPFIFAVNNVKIMFWTKYLKYTSVLYITDEIKCRICLKQVDISFAVLDMLKHVAEAALHTLYTHTRRSAHVSLRIH
jgi:hypothetical protein